MTRGYTDEKNIQILLALLKAHNIKRIVASPGSTNHTMLVVFKMTIFLKCIHA